MKLTSLNKSQKLRLKEIKEEFINKFLSFQEIDKKKAIALIEFVYPCINKPIPIIYKVSSPKAGQLLANKLNGTTKKIYNFGTFLTIGWASFYAYYETFVEFGILTKDKFPKYFQLREMINSGIFLTIEFDKAIIIIEKPIVLKRLNASLHCTDGPAIQWRDGYCQYYINGRSMPNWIFEKTANNTLTKEEFINEENEEIKAGIYEILESRKEGTMLEFLGAQEVDRRSFVHYNGDVEEMILYKTSETFQEEIDLNGKSNVPLAWIKMSCPSTGTNYLIPSDSSFSSCEDAAKYHRPNEIPTEIKYLWNARS